MTPRSDSQVPNIISPLWLTIKAQTPPKAVSDRTPRPKTSPANNPLPITARSTKSSKPMRNSPPSTPQCAIARPFLGFSSGSAKRRSFPRKPVGAVTHFTREEMLRRRRQARPAPTSPKIIRIGLSYPFRTCLLPFCGLQVAPCQCPTGGLEMGNSPSSYGLDCDFNDGSLSVRLSCSLLCMTTE